MWFHTSKCANVDLRDLRILIQYCPVHSSLGFCSYAWISHLLQPVFWNLAEAYVREGRPSYFTPLSLYSQKCIPHDIDNAACVTGVKHDWLFSWTSIWSLWPWSTFPRLQWNGHRMNPDRCHMHAKYQEATPCQTGVLLHIHNYT